MLKKNNCNFVMWDSTISLFQCNSCLVGSIIFNINVEEQFVFLFRNLFNKDLF